MTTAHRPTFDPARGKEAQRGPAYHQRLMPAHTQLKIRQAGQGGAADAQPTDLKARLLQAEAAHYAKDPSYKDRIVNGDAKESNKRRIEAEPNEDKGVDGDLDEDLEVKKQRVLEETKAIDASSDSSDEDSDDEESEDDEEDETAELLRELEKIKRERAERKEQEEREKAAIEEEQRESEIAYGNPLLQPEAKKSGTDSSIRRRWDDDVVFRNQARGTEKKSKPEFVNDLLRSDFHKRFMGKYVR